MPYTETEKEVVFLKAVQELIDEMVNHEVLSIIGTDPDSEVRFPSITHMKFFNIILVDFLSLSDENVMGENISYLGALKRICDNPQFNVDNSVHSLKEEVEQFADWLEQEVEVEIWLPTAEIHAILKIQRIEFIKICGNISKHSFQDYQVLQRH